ncbi:MAG: LacI family DNA-binding transcriptional regulator [Planctomycetes bacterium]|nr:LacI family DNA-binding transcriptional regulator [Planctomycetota bacterium]
MPTFRRTSKMPLHAQVAERIKEMIAQSYAPGDTIPTHQDLTKILGVGRVTVTRAIEVLVSQGIVSAAPSRGTVVQRRVRPSGASLGRIGIICIRSMSGLFRGDYMSEMLQSIARRTEMLGADLQFFTSLRSKKGPSMEEISDSGVDGVILLGVVDHAYIAQAAAWGVPVVVVDHHDAKVPLDYVAVDNAGTCVAIVNLLVKLGHRELAYVDTFAPKTMVTGETAVESDAAELRQGVRRAAEAAGVKLHEPLFSLKLRQDTTDGDLFSAALGKNASGGDDLAEVIEILSARGGGPTALLTSSENTAADVVTQLAQKGIKVPEDVSVASTTGAALDSSTASLTYCRVNFREMGEQAVDLLQFRTRRPGPSKPHVVRIGFDLVEGQTTGPAPR